MIIVNNRKFIAASFANEDEIERVVLENAEYIFGPDSIMLPKSLIRSADGSGTIPDGYVSLSNSLTSLFSDTERHRRISVHSQVV